MALTIEDGTIVANANSFVTVAEARAFALTRGVTLSADDAVVEQLLTKALDYIKSLEPKFQGYRVESNQVLPWPRWGVVLHGFEFSSAAIPQQLKDGQCQLAIDAVDAELQANGTGRVVKKEQVGPLSTEYADDGASNPQLNPTAALNFLKPLFSSYGSGGTILVDR